MLCVECYHDNLEGVAFCENCGCPFKPSLQEEKRGNTDLLACRYRIISALTEGGMGSVSLGYDVRLNKVCAIKELFKKKLMSLKPEEYQDNINLFKKEVELLANLRHPNIPCVTDYFLEKEHYYLVMDYIEGKDLELILEEKGDSIPEKQVVEWAIQVCRILEYLHGQIPPIIHGDIKPANLIIRKSDGLIMLVDFGSAYTDDLKKGEDISYGSEGYAPPEQYLGDMTPGCDLYSLGVTMYELLTGGLPVNNFKFISMREVRQDLVISEDIDLIVLKAVNIKPEERFQSAGLMKQLLLSSYNKRFSPSVNKFKTNTLIMPFHELPPCQEKKNIKIMIVDDEANIREAFTEMVGYFSDVTLVGQASNGEEAINVFLDLKEKPDVLLMDIKMPGLNGIEATKKLIKICPDLKVIIFSAYIDEELFTASLNAGAVGYIYKIGTPWKELEELIKKAVDGEYTVSLSTNSFFMRFFKENKLLDIQKQIIKLIEEEEFDVEEIIDESDEEDLVFPSKKYSSIREEEKDKEDLETVTDDEVEIIIEEVDDVAGEEEIIKEESPAEEKVIPEETSQKEISRKIIICPLCSSGLNRFDARFCKDCGQKLYGEDLAIAQSYLTLIDNFLKFDSVNNLITEIHNNKEKLNEQFFDFLDRKTEIYVSRNHEKADGLTYLCKIMGNLNIRESLLAADKAVPVYLDIKSEVITTSKEEKQKEVSSGKFRDKKAKKKKFAPMDSSSSSLLMKKRITREDWKSGRVKADDKSHKRLSVSEYRKYAELIKLFTDIDEEHLLLASIDFKKKDLDDIFFTVLKRQIEFALTDNDHDELKELRYLEKILKERLGMSKEVKGEM
ncbi:MAG TPA: protein kinase [Candidatus Eremiobacteraeota bacterium]|nr:protein kinase [Candidatus Eremiobacteraeota bacterium]